MCPTAGAESLWKEGQSGLFTSQRTFKVGDILQIRIEETTRANHDWKSERKKEADAAGTAAAAGAGAGTKNLLGLFFPFMDAHYDGEYTTDNNAERTTRLSAQVSAEVVNILPNGNLQVIARKTTRVNSEEQQIELTGNIRPEDVSPRNVASSNAIADAQIRINGTVRFTNGKKPNAFDRFFSFLYGIFF